MEYNYNFKLNLICTIKNIVAIICCTILAIVFNHWWIIFFSILLFGQVRTSNEEEKEGKE